MLIVLSPAKTLDYDTRGPTTTHSRPEFTSRASELIKALRTLDPSEVGSLMKISDPLAALNAARYASWSRTSTVKNARQAVLAFNGDVYEGLDARNLTAAQLEYADAHVRILSGLYGVLRPLDLMQPYRLEMGTRLATARGNNLYQFWGDTVTKSLNAAMHGHKAKTLINLASEEYFKVVQPALLAAPVVTPIFQEWKGGRFKVISFFAKRARGLMTRYAITKKISDPEKLKHFDSEGYAFIESESSASHWMFRRGMD